MVPSGSQAVRVSLVLTSGLLALKVAAGVITGSLGILAQAAGSFFELSAVIILFLVAGIASRPADQEHPFGHGKIENIAAVIQALVMFLVGGLIVYYAARRMVDGPAEIQTVAGMAVMAFSILVSFVMFRYLTRIARMNNSVILGENVHAVSVDLYSGLAVLIGLIIVHFTGAVLVDLVIALLFSLWIFRSGVMVLRRSSPSLIDVKLPQNEEEIIRSTIMEHCSQLVGFHDLRTRNSGDQRYIDLHLVVPRAASVAEAHRVTEHLEQDIRRKLPHTSMIIHIEPCDSECETCSCPCSLRKKPGNQD